jgi:hypothetical protein
MWIHQRALLGVAILLQLAVSSVAAAAEQPVSYTYVLSSTGTITTQAPEGPRVVTVDTRLSYTWAVTPSRRVLTINSMSSKITAAGVTVMQYSADAALVVSLKDGVEKKTPVGELPPEKRECVEDAFGKPACVLEVDANGRETGRKMTMTNAAKRLLGGDGVVTNVLFFHPVTLPAGKSWAAERTLDSGDAGTIGGTIEFKESPEAGPVKTFAISGSLKPSKLPDEKVGPRDFTCALSGRQTFDPNTKVWQSARVTADMGFESIVEGKSLGNFVVKMTYEVAPAKNLNR